MYLFKRFFYTILCTTLALTTTPSHGQVTGGGTTYAFLNLTSAPRVAALGGIALATTANDVNFAFYNPALLDSTSVHAIAINYVNYLADIKLASAVYAGKISKIGYYTVGFQFFDYGKFTRTDAGANELGDFYPQDYVLQMGYAMPLKKVKNLSVATNIKFIGSQYDTYSSVGVASDLLLSYQNKATRLAAVLAVKNLGSQLKPYVTGNYEPLPFDVQLNISKRLEHLPFRAGVVLHHLHQWNIRYDDPADRYYKERQLLQAGETPVQQSYFFDKALRHVILNGELSLGKSLNVQFGYNHLRRQELSLPNFRGRNGISFGVGIDTKRFGFSYANSAYSLVGASHHIAINLKLDSF